LSTVALALRQAGYDLRAFRRNPASAFFTFVFPLMFLVIFNLVFGDQEIEVPGGTVDTSTFYVPAIVALSVINACYTNVAMGVTFSRERGVLKRVRGTPLQASVFLAGRILQAMAIAVVLVVLVLGFGTVLYGVDIDAGKLPAFSVSLLAGAGCFCALGLAVSGFVPNADAAPAVVNASVMPLLFISNVFIPTETAPDWLNSLASLFPVVHLADSLHAAFNPYVAGSGFDWLDIGVLALWGAIGVVIAARYFSWEPRR
jgi:ABC-2 type transport system permease protein